MIVVMFGTSKKPSPKPATNSASATTASGVAPPTKPSAARPTASSASPATAGAEGADAIGESTGQRSRHRRAERREHEEEAADEGAEPARLDQVERHQQPDREDRAAGDEGQGARAQHGPARQVSEGARACDRARPVRDSCHQRPGEHRERDRDTHVIHGAPAEGFDERARRQRAQQAEPHGRAQKPSRRPRIVGRRPERAQRGRGAVDQPAREALDDARDEEPVEARRRAAHHERDHAQRDAGTEHGDVPELIRGGAPANAVIA